MDRELRARLFRRAVHLSSAGLLSYYLVPPDMWGFWPGRWVLVLTFLVPVLTFEAWRWRHRPKVDGLRENERRRVSAVAWGAVGLALAFVLFPEALVVPCVLGLALVDPLIGELRSGMPRAYPVLPFLAYLAICLLAGLGPLMSLAAAIAALLAEAPKVAAVDDDFRMLVAPLVVLWLLEMLPLPL